MLECQTYGHALPYATFMCPVLLVSRLKPGVQSPGSQSIFVSALFQSNLCHVAFVEIALRVLVCGTGTVATRIWEMVVSDFL